MILEKEQRIGAIVLSVLVIGTWVGLACYQSWCGHGDVDTSGVEPPKKHRTWEERRDSMRMADSLRYARWAKEREQRYDSFKRVDSMRRAEWKRIRQQQYDSFRIADSLWRDSVGWRFVKRVKKDTILNLNRCDTTELQYIRGIGRFTAVQIVRYREQLGGFYAVKQLTDEALQKCRLDTLLRYFEVDSNDVKKINVNSCSIETLQRHPYLRFTQAKAIYELRRREVKLKDLEDLKVLPELTEEELQRIAPYLTFE